MVRPKTSQSQVKTEMEKVEQQLDTFEQNVKDLTQDRMNEAPLKEEEPQTKISSKEAEKSKEIYLKPERRIAARQKFNEKWREQFNFAKEYVQFIAEHKEIIGEAIEIWTRPFGGMDAEYWRVPTNKPVWGPRYLAEQIRSCKYHRLTMQQNVTNSDGVGQFYGQLVADTTVARLTAEPVSSKKSIFMGAGNF
jgi:hypothetical protein